MTHTELVQGAARQSWKPDNPEVLLASILDAAENPHDRATIHDEFLRQIFPESLRDRLSDDAQFRMIRNCIEYWFDNNYKRRIKVYPPLATAIENMQTAKQRRNAAVASTVRTLDANISAIANRRLLDWIMPNGKALSDCTGADIRKAKSKLPAWLQKIAAKVKPREIVGKVMTEVDVRKLAPRDWA